MNKNKLIKLIIVFVSLAFLSVVLLVAFREKLSYPNPKSLIIYPDETVMVDRLSKNSIKLRWKNESKTVKICYSKSLSKLKQPGNSCLEVDGTKFKNHIVSGLEDNERYYFLLIFKNDRNEKQTITVSERILPLSGANNFRDLGGYIAKDGRRVKWGMLYRSSSLSGLTRKDKEYLSKLNIKSIYDLRTIEEKESDPDIVPKGIKYYNMPIYSSEDQPGGFAMLLPGADIDAIWDHFYKTTLIDKKAKQYGDFLKSIANKKNLPAVFHCTAGKDRAGIVTALFLITLGIPDETIIADYTLSNKYFDSILHHAQEEFDKHKIVMSILNVNAENLAPFYLADPKIITSTLSYIREKYGSYENYLINAGGINRHIIKELKKIYLN